MKLVYNCFFIISMCTGIVSLGMLEKIDDSPPYNIDSNQDLFSDDYLYTTFGPYSTLSSSWQNIYNQNRQKNRIIKIKQNPLENTNDKKETIYYYTEPKRKCFGLCCSDTVNFNIVNSKTHEKMDVFSFLRSRFVFKGGKFWVLETKFKSFDPSCIKEITLDFLKKAFDAKNLDMM